MTYEEAAALLKKYDQEHLLKYYGELLNDEKKALLAQIEKIDFGKIVGLYNNFACTDTNTKISEKMPSIEPISYTDIESLSDAQKNEYKALGENIIAQGGFAAITMAGGQGTRLGHNGPKGTFDIGLANGWSLFQIQCERLKKVGGALGCSIPWYIMTSRENDAETRAFFEKNNYFGYKKEDIFFFIQNMLPQIEIETGKIVLDSKGHIKEGADGHGGIFAALKTSGAYNDMKKRGIKWAFIGGIDNVLLRLADALFIGFAEKSGAKIAGKSLVKRDAKEGVGVFCKKDGRPSVVEYTEISPEMAAATDEAGNFIYGDAHILCNIFSMDAIDEILSEKDGLPYHVAKKKVVDASGRELLAYKFEAFIFDAFEYFDDLAILRVSRASEFAPVKNKEGNDSPATAKEMYEAEERKGTVL